MLRNLSLAVALLAFAGAAFAECDASHGAKRTITEDQAQAPQQAPVKKAVAPAPKKSTVAAEKPAKDGKPAQASIALAPDGAARGDKPAN